MGQVAALVELHAQDPIAGADRAEVGRHVGLGPRVGLDVDVLGAGEQRQGALLGEPLGDVDELAAAVVALARQALGVLVGEPAALRLEDRREDVVLAGDELDLVVLATALADHRRPQLGVDIGDRGPGESRGGGGGHRDPSVLRSRSPGSRRPAPSSHNGRLRRGRRPCRGRAPAGKASAAQTMRQLGLIEGRGQDIGRDRALPQDPRWARGAVDHRRGDPTRRRATVQDEHDPGSLPSWARTASAESAGGSPERFAELTGSGPRAAASARGESCAGSRRPIVAAPPLNSGAGPPPAAGAPPGSDRRARRRPPARAPPHRAGPHRRPGGGRPAAGRSPRSSGRSLAANSRPRPPGARSATASP